MSAITIQDSTNTYTAGVNTSGQAQIEDTRTRQTIEDIYLKLVEQNNNLEQIIYLLSQRTTYTKGTF